MQIDSYVGELLDAIDDLDIANNTIFIFTADNGPEALEAGSTSLTVETAVHGSAGTLARDPVHRFRGRASRSVCHSLAWQDCAR